MPEQSAGGPLEKSPAEPRHERPAHQAAGAVAASPGAADDEVQQLDVQQLEVHRLEVQYAEEAPDPATGEFAVPEDTRSIAPAVAAWRGVLAGTGMPDTLIAVGPHATASWLDLTHAHPSGLAQLFAGRQTRLSSLFRENVSHAVAWRQARAIRASALVLASQRGVQGSCLSIGVATWLPGDALMPDAAVQAPVVLRGCSVRPRGAGGDDFDLELDDSVLINPQLVRTLTDDFGVPADGVELANLAHGPKGFDPRPVYTWLEEHCAGVTGFRIERSLVLATFAAGSGAVLADLDAAVPAIGRHRLLGPVARSLLPAVIDLDGAHPHDSGAPPAATVAEAVAQPDDGPARPAQPEDTRPEDDLAVAPARSMVPVQVTPPGETRRLAMIGRLGPRGVRPVKPPAEPDPVTDLLVLDLDPAQRVAVDAVLRGDDVLVEGPPGTGVTHTLTAAIARLVAGGRSVLVLSPRRASTEALLARLDAAGIADLVLDLRDPVEGGTSSGPATVLAALEAASGPVAALPRPGRAVDDGTAEAVRRTRDLLDGEAEALHQVRDPWGVSCYDAMVALAELSGRTDPPQCPVRLSTEALQGLDAVSRERLRSHLQAAAAAGAFTLSRADTRWFDAGVTTAMEARRALEAAMLLRSGLGRTRAAMDQVATAAGLHQARFATAWLPLLDLMLGVRQTVDSMEPQVYEHDLDLLVAAVAPRALRAGTGIELGRGERRRLRKAAQALVRPGVHVADLHRMLVSAREQKDAWAKVTVLPELPRVVSGLSEADAAVRRTMAALDVLAEAFAASTDADPRTIPLEDLEHRVLDLAADTDGVLGQPRRATLIDGLRRGGYGEVVDDFRARRVGPERVDAEVDQLWWASVRDSIVAADPRLARHDRIGTRRSALELRAAVREQIDEGAGLVRAAVVARAARTVARHPDQVQALREELTRTDRRPRLADLVPRCGDVLAGLTPVWVMNPDTVAACLAPADPQLPAIVDAVVVDDAGYIGIAEVAAALVRGAQVVAGGDRRRQSTSAPTGGPSTGSVPSVGSLGSVGSVQEHGADQVAYAEGAPSATGTSAVGDPGRSVAEAVAPFATVCRLERDHRTTDGRILQPLVPHYREGWQLTPGIEALPSLRLEPVPQGMAVPPPGEELPVSADAEVFRVVDLVEAHAVDRPEESLAVITLGERHAERIEEALRAQLPERPALARWLSRHWGVDEAEPFCVRPVQRAQGLERDTVVVAVGLARTPHGRVLHRFGPLDAEHGPAVLLAALSRSRSSTTVVCCFTAEDLVLERLRTPGGRLLRDVLLAAGGRSGARPGRSATGVDGLVGDLRSRLAAAGLPVQARVGDRAWPLDLAVEDPRVPGRMLLGIDLDGPAFAGRACGERERLRPQRWERAGWTYLKVSALDYFSDPALEVQRIRAAWEQAMDAPIIGRPELPPMPEPVVPAFVPEQLEPEVAITPVIQEPTHESIQEPVIEARVIEEPVIEAHVLEKPVIEAGVTQPGVIDAGVIDAGIDLGPMVDPDPPAGPDQVLDVVPLDPGLPSGLMETRLDDDLAGGQHHGPEDGPEQTRDDTDQGWGESTDDRDAEILRERPPHW